MHQMPKGWIASQSRKIVWVANDKWNGPKFAFLRAENRALISSHDNKAQRIF